MMLWISAAVLSAVLQCPNPKEHRHLRLWFGCPAVGDHALLDSEDFLAGFGGAIKIELMPRLLMLCHQITFGSCSSYVK